MHAARVGKRRPPKDWESAERHGEMLWNFFPCKTPLGDLFTVDAKNEWRPEHALSALRLKTGFEPCAVFDLTNGGGFYERHALPWGLNADFKAIPCGARSAARDDPPRDVALFEFYLAMQSLRSDAPVVIHCTHGFNRTGFLMIWYAVTAGLCPTVQEGLRLFSIARPPGIYKASYVSALCIKLGAEPPLVAPPWPHWRRDRAVGGLPEIWATQLEARRLAEPPWFRLASKPKSPHDVGSVLLPQSPTALYVKSTLGDAFGVPATEFGGSQPLALGRAELPGICHGHVVSWKSDGDRYLVAVLPFGTFGINRKKEVGELALPYDP